MQWDGIQRKALQEVSRNLIADQREGEERGTDWVLGKCPFDEVMQGSDGKRKRYAKNI